MQTGGSTYYYVTNLQGDVVALLDASGNAVASYAYDPYGKILSAEGTMAETNPLRYRGYYYGTESGLYYLQSRYYDPATCRFVNADNAAVIAVSPEKANWDKNLFAYCDNDPISRKDDGGKLWNTIIGGIVNGLVAGILDGPSEGGFWNAAKRGFVTGAISGFGIDVCIATGGTAGFLFAMVCGGSSGILDTIWKANNRNISIDRVEVGVNAVVGALVNGLFGAYGRVPGRATGSKPPEIANAMWKNTKDQVLTRGGHWSMQKMARNLASGLAESAISVGTGRVFGNQFMRMLT